ncbi:hypothetical protein PSECIP111951_00569 [Pseudoalteromonas holothuriae]|uniref:MAE-28990/MAE-18760-like HEPN domain-containing protein n=1 Tax=Pseudoalteromonas holothuriae TaxID=2963714 RepID=A0ABM9GE82_9GAMM|nr:MAE_28990/MAE_18760 family HEPN-like nuclease [Pseudoalteromonas sp. CIP111951]CAH9052207.1 hypothetical protein PSECIP111951_00569 [Pseudoalteromonas sp. CIP111951]
MTSKDFTTMLEADLGWRKKEVANLLLMETEHNQLLIIKSSVLLLYSHWEGFVKNATKAYLEHVSDKKVGIGALTDNFKAISLKGLINEVDKSCETLTMTNELNLISKLQNSPHKKFMLPRGFSRQEKDKTIVNTKDNLSLKVFKSILHIVGIDYATSLDTKGVFIDEKLLENRNKVAHGNRIERIDNEFDLTIDELKKLKDLVFFLMSALVDDLIYYAEKELYFSDNAHHMRTYLEQRAKEIESYLP